MAIISVIIPVYKVENYIHLCIDSVLAQTFQDYDVILVDDGSPDRCGEICDQYAAKDSRIHVIHRQNGGLSAARNTGIEWALSSSDSQYLTFIDSDDWIHPQYLEILADAAADAEISMVGRHYTDTYDECFSAYTLPLQPTLLEPEALFLSREWDFNFAWGKLYRKNCFREIRYPEGKIFEDVFTTYRLIFAQPKIALVDEPLYCYFYNPAGISHSLWNPKELVILDGMRQQMAFYRENGFEKALEKEEKLYVNHHAYQLTRIRENKAHWQENKVYWKKLRKEMLLILKENSDKYNRRTMPQCYEAAWPVKSHLLKRIHNVIRIWRDGGMAGILARLKR